MHFLFANCNCIFTASAEMLCTRLQLTVSRTCFSCFAAPSLAPVEVAVRVYGRLPEQMAGPANCHP